LNSADLHVDGYAINVAPPSGKVCVVLPEGRDDGDCAGLDLGALRTRKVPALAVVRHGDAHYELAIDRVVEKDIGATTAEALKQRGTYELVTIAGSPAARFARDGAIVYEVPSDDRALTFTFTGAQSDSDAMVKSIVRPRADLTLYGKPAAEQAAFRKQYASAFERTQLAVRIGALLAIVLVLVFVVRALRKKR